MIRVGIALGVSWLGSVNYYRNLLNAICQLPNRKIEPVLIIGNSVDVTMLAGFPPVEVIRSSWFDSFKPGWIVRKVCQQTIARDPLLEQFLRNHRVDVLSHSDFLGKRAELPAICWIGDFQHRRQPQFFKATERWYRDRDFRQQCRHATRVILSSYDALHDLEAFEPSHIHKARVLQFVAQPTVNGATATLEALQERYDFSAPYFHVPNQFWAHKNHRLILDALKILKDRGESMLVISTGATEDYRSPEYFAELMAYSRHIGITDNFKVLGIVPYDDLVGLMVNAIALLNPSRAEGWSTSVEEAKSLGKRIILSNLAVHLEQAPPDGVFIDPDNATNLADAMSQVKMAFDRCIDEARMARAKRDLPSRIQSFAMTYQDIVLEAVNLKNGEVPS